MAESLIEWTPPPPKKGGQWRDRNVNWKGGRSIASNGTAGRLLDGVTHDAFPEVTR